MTSKTHRFAEKVVIVTAAGGTGTGGATARRFVEEGAYVVASDVDEDGLASLAGSAPGDGKLVTQPADVSNPDHVRALVDTAINQFGKLDVLVNHAGIGNRGRVHEVELDDWRKVMSVTLDSVYLCSKAAIPHLISSKGCIVNTASISGMGGDYAMAAYDAAKGGVINLTRAMAIDYGEDGVRVNAVSPAAIWYPGTQPTWEKIADQYLERVALRRFAYPEDIAAAITFLASDDASFITGQNLAVDGGVTAASGQLQFTKLLR